MESRLTLSDLILRSRTIPRHGTSDSSTTTCRTSDKQQVLVSQPKKGKNTQVVTPCPNNLGYSTCCQNVPAKLLLQHWLQHPQDIHHPDNHLHSLFTGDDVYVKVVDYVRLGGDIRTVNADGRNLLHLSIIKPDTLEQTLNLVTYLCSLEDIDVSVGDDKGDTAVTLLAQRVEELAVPHNLDVVTRILNVLIQRGAHINESNKSGYTLLSYCLKQSSSNGCICLLRVLLNLGADVVHGRLRSCNYPLAIFIRSVMKQGVLDTYSDKVLHILAIVMSSHPAKLEAAVLTALVAEARYPKSSTNIILSIRQKFEEYWRQPASLTTMSALTIRHTLMSRSGCVDPRQLHHLALPDNLVTYLNLQNIECCCDTCHDDTQPAAPALLPHPLNTCDSIQPVCVPPPVEEATYPTTMPKTEATSTSESQEFVALTLQSLLQTSYKSL